MLNEATIQALRFIPLTLSTLGLILVSFFAKNKKKLNWLIIAFIIWLLTFFYAIGIFG